MQYYVIAPDGQKYGPADVPTLNRWATEGRVLATNMLEDASSGERIIAGMVPGLVFPTAPPAGNPYQEAPQYSAYPRGMNQMDDGSRDFTLSWVFSAISIPSYCGCAVIGLGFSIAGIVFAVNCNKKGHPKGKLALWLAIGSILLYAIAFAIVMVVALNSPQSR